MYVSAHFGIYMTAVTVVTLPDRVGVVTSNQ